MALELTRPSWEVLKGVGNSSTFPQSLFLPLSPHGVSEISEMVLGKQDLNHKYLSRQLVTLSLSQEQGILAETCPGLLSRAPLYKYWLPGIR